MIENKTYEQSLNPNNFKIDNREILDFILFLKEYSKGVLFYNKENNVDETWYELLKSDETFLIAEISKFNIKEYSSNRVSLIKKYDEAFSIKQKEEVFKEFFNSTLFLFQKINEWYLVASKNNLTKKSSLIEVELETIINEKLFILLNDFYEITQGFIKNKLLSVKPLNDFKDFSPIWKLKNELTSEKLEFSGFDENQLNFAFKRITLIFNPTYEIIYNLVHKKSNNLFKKSLYENENHKAHIGLLFSFLELFKYSLIDLNSLTKKHLDLYFKKILKFKQLDPTPTKIFVSFDIDENIDFLNIQKGNLLKVGQRENGEDILFALDEDSQLNNISLAHISTFFLSENKVFDHLSRFNLISGLYYKTHAVDQEEVSSFNSDKTFFSTLGEEQNFLNPDKMNMDKANIGFMISSPVLTLSKSNRTINIDFNFTIDSIKYLSDLIIDIAQNRSINEEDVFDEVFFNAFEIEFTSNDGWSPISNYKVISPKDWSTGIIRISLDLDKKSPSIVQYSLNNHNILIDTEYPVIKFKINQNSFYNSYSFLNGMKLHKIDLNIKVRNLKKLNCYTNGEELDIKSEFDLFGINPKRNSNLVIGTDELFNKKIENLSINWNYKNLNIIHNNLEDYYKEYNLGIRNNSFKINITALSNFEFGNSNDKELEFNLFDLLDDNKISDSKSLEVKNASKLEIKPNYNLKPSDFDEFSNDKETGYLKLELKEPSFGFGSELYDKVFNKITQESLENNSKKRTSKLLKFPNDPYSPSISDLSIDYDAKSSLIFNQALFSENDFDEKNGFFLLSPFGVEKTLSEKAITKNTIVESFNYEGELILGFENYKPTSQLSLLFEILKSENQNYEYSRNLDWFYFSTDGWRILNDKYILFDQTMNLMKTGVLCFKIPEDIVNKKSEYNNRIYIKACSKNKTNQFSLLRSIRTNSASASELLANIYESNDFLNIPPYSVEGFLEPIEGVINSVQHLNSKKGKNKESDLEFYIRSSEILRHKNRPVTKWDYEKFVLSKFNWLSHVKCFLNSNDKDQVNIQLLCIKKIEFHENIENIKLSSAEKEEIKEYVKKFISPFAIIEVINPVFEDLWIKCKLIFKNISNGQGIKKLNFEFFDFICSWLYKSSEISKIGVSIKKMDIVNFLNTRDYISFVTGISVIHLKKSHNGDQIAFDSASKDININYIKPGGKWSLIVPKNNHIIEILENNEYHIPEPIKLNELGIETSFLINSEVTDLINDTEEERIEKKQDDSKYNFILKF